MGREKRSVVDERSVVKEGGVAGSDAEIEDVSRDTYGSPATANVPEGEPHERARRRAEELLGEPEPEPPGQNPRTK